MPRPTAHGPRPTAHGPRPIDPLSVVCFVVAWAVRVLRLPEDDARDLGQETWIRLAEAQRPRTPEAPWRGLAIQIARNLHLDRCRAGRRRRRHETLAMRRESDGGADDPVELLERRERADRVRQAVSALDTRDRGLLLRWIDDDRPVRDLASEDACSKSAVHERLAKISARLKLDLRDVEGDDSPEGRRRARA